VKNYIHRDGQRWGGSGNYYCSSPVLFSLNRITSSLSIMEKEHTNKELRVNESCDVCYVSDNERPVALKEEIIEEGVISEISEEGVISLITEEGVITWTSSFINIHLSLVMLL
jgi:hypothetical protein